MFTSTVAGSLSKSKFCYATHFSIQKFCGNNMGQKPTTIFKNEPEGKTLVNCACLRSKTQILRHPWKHFARPYGCTVAPFRNSVYWPGLQTLAVSTIWFNIKATISWWYLLRFWRDYLYTYAGLLIATVEGFASGWGFLIVMLTN